MFRAVQGFGFTVYFLYFFGSPNIKDYSVFLGLDWVPLMYGKYQMSFSNMSFSNVASHHKIIRNTPTPRKKLQF